MSEETKSVATILGAEHMWIMNLWARIALFKFLNIVNEAGTGSVSSAVAWSFIFVFQVGLILSRSRHFRSLFGYQILDLASTRKSFVFVFILFEL